MPKQTSIPAGEAELNIIANLPFPPKKKFKKIEEKELIFLATYHTTFKSNHMKAGTVNEHQMRLTRQIIHYASYSERYT